MSDGLVLAVMALVAATRRPPPPVRPAGSSPGKTSTPPAADAIAVRPGDQLVPGGSYRAQIKLAGLEAMLGTANAVKAKLEGAGFRNVRVTDKGGGKFEASGSWGGAAVAAKLPPQVVAVWLLPSAAPPPPTLAMLYRLPADGYDTTRVATQEPGQQMRKRGIFANPKAAWDLIASKGWKAQPEVQQLQADPPEGPTQ